MQDEHLPQSVDLTPIRQPTLSSTGGPLQQAEIQSSEIGMPPSERGVVELSNRDPQVAKKLAPFTLPEETTWSLSNSLLSRLEIRTTPVYSADGQFDGAKLAPFTIRPGWRRDELSRDLKTINALCRGGNRTQVAHEVAKLLIRTKTRAHGEGEGRLLAETLVEDLCRYPTDVVRFACEYWVEGGRDAKFTPSWPELKEICDKRMDGRLRLKRAIEHHLSECQSGNA